MPDDSGRGVSGPTAEALFTREEALGGLPARRASALLFIVESRTAHLVARSRDVAKRFVTEQAIRERAFLEAFALGREPPLRPTIQDLERHAPEWASLIPESPRLRAAVAHLLGRKYRLTARAAPGIRAALGPDDVTVQEAYRRLYGRPLEAIYASEVGPLDRLRWAWARVATKLENLPPFWTAFALVFTEIVCEGALAVPIAVAWLGPLAGIVVLIVLGVVNMLTMACLVEAITRSGTMRYGDAFVGRLVTDYLGSAGAIIFSLALVILCVVEIPAFYIGVASTLAEATTVRAEVWTALMFLIGMYFLSRESLEGTIASALAVGAISIGLLLALSLLALPHVQAENLLHVNVPFVGGRPFEPEVVGLVFGVVVGAYFGHLSMTNAARVVLQRDPGGRSLIGGAVAGQACAMVLYCLWVVAVNGTIEPADLAHEAGTVLVPLAAVVGPIILALGTVYVILGMGMASIHTSLSLFNSVLERLPAPTRTVVLLPRLRGQLPFHPRGEPDGHPRIGIRYLGPEGGSPRLRLDVQTGDGAHREEVVVDGHWDIAALADRLSGVGARLSLEVLDAGDDYVRLRVDSSMTMTYSGPLTTAGLHVLDILTLPDDQRHLIAWLTRRREASLAEAAAQLGQDETTVRATLDGLVEQGAAERVTTNGEPHYRVVAAARRGRQLSPRIWQALDGSAGEAETARRRSGLRAVAARGREILASERGRFLAAASPIFAIFLFTEWLILIDADSFAELLSFNGLISISLLAGIFPALLVVAARRKGGRAPALVLRLLGHPLMVAFLYLLFLLNLYVHGLIIWEEPFQRAAVLVVGTLALVATIMMVRRGAFIPQAVVELRQEGGEAERGAFAVTVAGRPRPAEVELTYADGAERRRAASGDVRSFAGLRSATFRVPAGAARTLKVWAHRVTPEGDSESLPARLTVPDGHEPKRFDLELSGGQVVLPIGGGEPRVEITLGDRSSQRANAGAE